MNAGTERVAVVGGGMAGLACARRLVDAGWEVEVFDKARKPGGRMSSRRAGDLSFDHGAQYFTARDESFQAVVNAWSQAGIVAPWSDAVAHLGKDNGRSSQQRNKERENEPRYVGTPTMSAVPRAMAQGLTVHAPVRITEVSQVPTGFVLADAEACVRAPYRWVVIATPAQQAVRLLQAKRELAAAAERATMQPCLAAMVAFDSALSVSFGGAFVHGGPLAWVARQRSKPHRPSAEAWVLHANPKWSAEHISEDPAEFSRSLLEAFAELVDEPLPPVKHRAGHRWRYAKANQTAPEGFLFDPKLRLAACGDWCMGSRVEDAWRSGHTLAERMLEAATNT